MIESLAGRIYPELGLFAPDERAAALAATLAPFLVRRTRRGLRLMLDRQPPGKSPIGASR